MPKLRTLTKSQLAELKALLLSLDTMSLTEIHRYTTGLFQVANKGKKLTKPQVKKK